MKLTIGFFDFAGEMSRDLLCFESGALLVDILGHGCMSQVEIHFKLSLYEDFKMTY